MSEATGYSSQTIHSAVCWKGEDFDYGVGDPVMLEGNLIIVDEASMMDQAIASILFERIKSGSRVVLVGDIDQLPSVGCGNVLADLDVYNTTSRMEREANLFAADFLLSDEDVLERVREGESDFYHMARELCVPSDFLAFKLYSMGNRGYRFRIPVELNSRFLK